MDIEPHDIRTELLTGMNLVHLVDNSAGRRNIGWPTIGKGLPNFVMPQQ